MGPQGTLVKYPTTGVWGPQRGNPPPHCRLALCLRRACVMPVTCVLQREDDKSDKGDDGSGTRTPPPEDNAAGWGGSGERVRDGPHDRAQREHAPCKPQRGDHRGCDRRIGRATTGATRLAPPPTCRGTSAAPRACTVLATCLRQGTSSEEAPPPLHPLLLHPPTHERGEDSEKSARGRGGGLGYRPKRLGER